MSDSEMNFINIFTAINKDICIKMLFATLFIQKKQTNKQTNRNSLNVSFNRNHWLNYVTVLYNKMPDIKRNALGLLERRPLFKT